MERILRGMILDLDGTLIDSNDAHAETWRIALEERGYLLPFERIRGLIGMGGDKLLPALVGFGKNSPEGKLIDERHQELFRTQCLPHLEPLPGAISLLRRMRNEGLRLAIASSSNREDLVPLLQKLEAEHLLEDETTSDEAAKSKPDADLVEITLGKLGCYPAEALMLGDTPYDIEAALKCGVRCIALRCGGWSDEALQGAVAIYDNPEDLLEHFEVSPLAFSPKLSRAA